MGILSKKWNEEEMLSDLGQLLHPGETLLAGVYCTYQDYGFFFSSKRVIAGYIGLTDQNRLIGTRNGIIQHEIVDINLNRAVVYIKELLFGAVHIRVSDPSARLERQRITFNRLRGGKTFPNHFENAATLLEKLQAFSR